MSWMVHTGARYHTQDTGYYCGAACAMVILAEIGVPYSDLDQDDLYDSNHDHNAVGTGWYTDPYGLRYTLVDRRPPGFSNTFVVHKPTSEADGTRDIVYTLHRYEVSPAALVFGCAHWITVPGSGGVNGTGNEYVTYADWQATYFTGCNYDHPSGSSQFISVCDPDVRDIEIPKRKKLKRPARGQKLLRPRDAIKFSQKGIDAYGLMEDKRVSRILRDAKPLEPQLVLRRDRSNSYYYLVPWGTDRGSRVMTRVDARFGTFSGIRLLHKQISNEFLTREAAFKLVANRRIRLPGERGSVKVFPEAVCVSPTLVWQPCWESWSPNLPFYQVNVGAATVFVRIDGKVFAALTTSGRGT